MRSGGRVLADLEQHLHHFRVGAAVQRAFQRADAGDDRRVHVGQRRRRDARGKRRGVQLVIGVQRQRDVHRAHGRRARAAGPSACRGSWPRAPSPDRAATGLPPCCMRPHVATRLAICAVSRTDLRYDACGELSLASAIVVAERRGQRPQRVHAVGRRQHLHQPDDRFGQRPCGGELRLQIAELGAVRQPAVPQQVAGFLEGREPREIVDVVPAIREHAAIAVEKQMADDVATTSSRPALAWRSVDTADLT